jgi:hypothetical protein
MSSKQQSFPFGPSGGIGGNAFYVAAPANAYKIIQVWGRSGARIDSIGVTWSTPDGVVSAGPFGATGQPNFTFDIPSGDYLTGIYGSVGEYNDSVRVFSLKFETMTKKISSTFGTQQSTQFNFTSPPDYQIAWIFGRAQSELDALGVVIAPIVK